MVWARLGAALKELTGPRDVTGQTLGGHTCPGTVYVAGTVPHVTTPPLESVTLYGTPDENVDHLQVRMSLFFVLSLSSCPSLYSISLWVVRCNFFLLSTSTSSFLHPICTHLGTVSERSPGVSICDEGKGLVGLLPFLAFGVNMSLRRTDAVCRLFLFFLFLPVLSSLLFFSLVIYFFLF